MLEMKENVDQLGVNSFPTQSQEKFWGEVDGASRNVLVRHRKNHDGTCTQLQNGVEGENDGACNGLINYY